jgi:hypothetical protein
VPLTKNIERFYLSFLYKNYFIRIRVSIMLQGQSFLLFSVIVTSLFLSSGQAGYAMDDDEYLQSMSASQTPSDTIELDGSVEIANSRASIIEEVKAQMREYPLNDVIRVWVEDMRRFYNITDEELR